MQLFIGKSSKQGLCSIFKRSKSLPQFFDYQFSDMFLKGFVVAAFVSVTFAAIARGPCKDAKKGGEYEKCSMDCDLDGSCSELVAVETCDCKNSAGFTTTTYNFKVIFQNLLHEQEIS